MYKKRETDCNLGKEQYNATIRNDMAIAINDKYPVVENHTLVLPIRHVASFFELGTYERNCCFVLIDEMRRLILEKDRMLLVSILEVMIEYLQAKR